MSEAGHGAGYIALATAELTLAVAFTATSGLWPRGQPGAREQAPLASNLRLPSAQLGALASPPPRSSRR